MSPNVISTTCLQLQLNLYSKLRLNSTMSTCYYSYLVEQKYIYKGEYILQYRKQWKHGYKNKLIMLQPTIMHRRQKLSKVVGASAIYADSYLYMPHALHLTCTEPTFMRTYFVWTYKCKNDAYTTISLCNCPNNGSSNTMTFEIAW